MSKREKRFTSIKLDPTSVELHWTESRNNNGGELIDIYTRTMTDTPHPDFREAINACKKEFLQYHGIDKQEADTVSVSGLKFSVSSIGDISKVSISGSKKAKNGQVNGMSAKGIMLDAEAKPFGFESDLETKAAIVVKEAEAYMNGKSAQMKMEFEQGEVPEEAQKKTVKKSPAAKVKSPKKAVAAKV